MSLLNRVAGAPEYRVTPTATLSNAPEWLINAFTSTATTYSGQTVSLDKALTLTPFRSAVQLISETVGLLPLKVYRDIDDGEKDAARGHRAWRMLHDKPNASTPAGRFWSTVATDLLIYGNAYLQKLRDPGGLVVELWRRDPRYMTVEWDDGMKLKRFREDGPYLRRTWTDEDLLHIFGWSTNGLTGESVLYRGRNTIGNAIAREEFEGGFYKRGTVLSLVVKHPGTLKDAGIQRLKGMFQSLYGGSANAHGTPVLEEGATVESVSPTLRDLQFEEAQQRSRTDIAVMFHVPPAFLGGSTGDSLTYSTIESNMTQYVEQAVAPITNTIEQSLAADPGVFPFPSWFPEFALDGLLRADSQSRANFYNIMHRIGAMTSNEIRGKENLPPKSGGEVLAPTVTPIQTQDAAVALDAGAAAAG